MNNTDKQLEAANETIKRARTLWTEQNETIKRLKAENKELRGYLEKLQELANGK